MKTLRRGHMGADVLQWQGIIGIGESGDFDADTESATMAWQRVRGLEPDGVVGPKTWGVAGFLVPSLTADLDDDFFTRLHYVAADLSAADSRCRPRDMLAVMMSESGVRANAHNDNPKHLPPEKRYNASGLIQFMPFILPGLGWDLGHEVFRELTATQQLEYVRRYYMPHRGHLHSVGGLYVATFLPALVKHANDPSFVLTGRDGPLAWAFAPNQVFDRNADFRITVGELEEAVARNCKGARWDEIVARFTAQDDVVTEPDMTSPATHLTYYPAASEEQTGSGDIIHPLSYPIEDDPDDEPA